MTDNHPRFPETVRNKLLQEVLDRAGDKLIACRARLAEATARKQVLILYKDDAEGNSEVIHVIVVPVHEDDDEWLAWLDKAREKAEDAGLRLYNWGNAAAITPDQAMELIE